ncbi:MAG: tetratricopeptide repeat protein [Syntrophorhabdaceae bacterium]|nr:tetratricopeptide repeat protein [Syntrophorhabdaceae bacterium]
MKGLLLLLLLVTSVLFAAGPGAADQTVTIVPPEGRVSDREARLALARMLSYEDDTLRASLADYRLLLKQSPEDAVIGMETAQVLLRLGMDAEAGVLLRGVYARDPGNWQAGAALADIECSRGHAKTCRELYLDVLQRSGQKPDLRLRFADRMNIWGDFYKARYIYGEHLARRPDDWEVGLKLARAFASSQRYEEAEGICRSLVANRKDASVLAALAAMKLFEKDFQAGELYAREALAIDPGSKEAADALGEALMFTGRYAEARSVYERTARQSGESAQTLVDIGRTFLKENRAIEARIYFKKALAAEPGNIAARFYDNSPNGIRSKAFFSSIVNDTGLSAAGLSQWADLYLSHGLFPEAIECLREALRRDPEYFPASISLAQVLGTHKQYEGSVRLYKDLAAQFPDDSKILIGLARVLAWSRRYDESMALYRHIIGLDPADPVPRREMARTAMWAKKPLLAIETYDAALSATGEDMTRPSGASKEKDGGEAFSRQRIHRSIYLEREAKRLAYNKRFTQSLPVYETLIDENPGNEEALFDKAQVACALGLCGLERKTYEKLLAIDPLHSLAGDGLDRLRSRSNPSARFDYSYWNEEGRGDLARITRNRFDVTFDVPVHCQYHLFLKGHRWLEAPDLDHATYGASGVSVGFAGAFNPFMRAEGSITHKRYDSRTLGSKDTGHGTLWFNVNDRVRLGAGYARTDELYNYFGIIQGVQADRAFVAFQGDITRKLEVSGKMEYIGYNDSNSGSFLGLAAGYAVTDHPRTFKVSLSGEMRNTRHNNEYIYQGEVLADIIHPYWTPRDYLAGSVILEWRHDLSKLFICGAEQHYYDLKASFGTDSENNPYAKIEGEWSWEFMKHWLLGIKGMAHTSPEWNATGAWTWLRYRF